jgi:uncharacterized protein YcfL
LTRILTSKKPIRVGEYHAIGYDMQGMSQQQLEATKTQLEQAKSKPVCKATLPSMTRKTALHKAAPTLCKIG